MKRSLLVSAAAFIFLQGYAQQLPFTYKIDSTGFSALQLEGGNVQVRLADLNNDGHLEIVTIGDHGSPNVNTNQHGISVFFGNGTGSGWTLQQSGSFGYGGCAVGDLNNDGKQDIAYSMHHNYSSTDFGDQLIEAALGNGTGTSWTPWDDGLATNGESWGMFGTDIADIDNDGWLDIGSNSFGAGAGIHIYRNKHDGTWQQTYQFGSGNTFRYLQFGDIDGDGKIDFVASNYQGSTFFGNGNGTFTLKQNGLPPLPASNGFPYEDVSLADIDNDGDDDFIFTYKTPSTGVTGVYVYSWDRTQQKWINRSSGLPSATNEKITVARAADIDMDGYADLVFTSDMQNNLQIWKGNGGSSWTMMYSQTLPALTGAMDIAIADVNHSGYPDILLWGSFLGGGAFNPSNNNKIHFFIDQVDPNAITATVTYPKGSECWPSGGVRFITWASAVPKNNSSSVKIEYSTAGNGGPWTTIVASTPNDGTYQWTVPTGVSSSNCFIRVTATNSTQGGSAVAMNSVPFNIGCTTSVTGMEEDGDITSIDVFPNPANDVVKVLYELNSTSNILVEVFDLLGKRVLFTNMEAQPAGQGMVSLHVASLPAGIYSVRVQNQQGVVLVKKLVVR